MLAAPLFAASIMVVLTVIVHFLGLWALSHLLKTRVHLLRPQEAHSGLALVVLIIVLALFALHTIEIWLYALLYILLGEFDALEPALYFSTASFTTVGFGDVVIDSRWRMVAAIESANGFLLLGWSTAFFLSVIAAIREINFPWPGDDRRDA